MLIMLMMLTKIEKIVMLLLIMTVMRMRIMKLVLVVVQEENRSGEEAKINNRMERLGKEISVLKVKVAEVNTALEDTSARQNTLGELLLINAQYVQYNGRGQHCPGGYSSQTERAW